LRHIGAGAGVQHLVETIEEHEGAAGLESALEEGTEARQAAAAVVVEGEEVDEGEAGVLAAHVVERGERSEDRQAVRFERIDREARGGGGRAAGVDEGEEVEKRALAAARVAEDHEGAAVALVESRGDRLAFRERAA